MKYREPSLEAKVLMTAQGPARRQYGRHPEWWGYIHCSWEERWLLPSGNVVTGTIARAMRKEYILDFAQVLDTEYKHENEVYK